MIRSSPVAKPFTIIFVCTGNQFRSALAAELMRRATNGLPVEVTSAGTLDLRPLPALPAAIQEADRLRVDLSTHRARSIRNEDLTAVDLVVGFERFHVVIAVVECKAARERSFTLPELVHYLELFEASSADEPVERARLAILRAHGARPPDPFPSSSAWEIADPVDQPRRVQRETADAVADLVMRLANGLFGSVRSPARG